MHLLEVIFAQKSVSDQKVMSSSGSGSGGGGVSGGGGGSGSGGIEPLTGQSGANADPQELTIFVQQLLQQMQSRFQTMSDTIISKIDEMGKRIDDLEHSLQDVMQQSGAGGAQSNPQ